MQATGANVSMATKTRVDIEKLVQWAYIDELSKRQTSAAEGIWDRLAQWGSIGGVDPDPGGRGNAQRYAQFGLPHPDAEEIERAVAALPVANWRNDFRTIAGEFAALVSINEIFPRIVAGRHASAGKVAYGRAPDGRGVRVKVQERARDVLLLRTISPAVLVTTHAIKRSRPDWSAGGHPQPAQIPAARGSGAMMIGTCVAKNRYSEGSYCPLQWIPSPMEIVLGRADYHVWHQALVRLSGSLELTEYEASPPSASATPWLEDQKIARLFSYAVLPQQPLPLKPQRAGSFALRKKFKRNKGRHVQVD